jgi:hypothetical protein
MHPSQVLDLKADMYVRAGEIKWQQMVETQFELDTLESINTDGSRPDPVKARNGARIISDRLQREIHQAHCYYVSPEMSEIIAWAAAKFEEDDFFRIDEIPTAHGFTYFEKPLKMTDVRGRTMLINCVVWFPSIAKKEGFPEYPTITLVYFNDQSLTPDDIALTVMKEYDISPMGRWGLIGMQGLRDHFGVGPETLPPHPEKILQLEAEGDTPHEFTNILRLMHAYWLMLNQTISDVSEAHIPRAFSKRARRMEIPDRVTVVALRRYEGMHHGDTSVEWQYRWLVRGHWRWQHVSEHHPLAEPDPDGGHRARVWVRPHVKGPEDRPLHLTSKVYGLIR